MSYVTRVVTYQLAYMKGEISLCASCLSDDAVRDTIPALGPVNHGVRQGHCDGCRLRLRRGDAEGPEDQS